jgi:hypothetical protein
VIENRRDPISKETRVDGKVGERGGGGGGMRERERVREIERREGHAIEQRKILCLVAALV